jgi:hypothetical protein
MNLIVKFTRIACLKYEMVRNADYLITNGNVEGLEIVNKPMRVHFGSHPSRSRFGKYGIRKIRLEIGEYASRLTILWPKIEPLEAHARQGCHPIKEQLPKTIEIRPELTLLRS